MKFDPDDIIGKRWGSKVITKYVGINLKDKHEHIYEYKCDCGYIGKLLREYLGRKHFNGCIKCRVTKGVKQRNERNQQVFAAYKQGKSKRKISQMLGVPRSTVGWIIKEAIRKVFK